MPQLGLLILLTGPIAGRSPIERGVWADLFEFDEDVEEGGEVVFCADGKSAFTRAGDVQEGGSDLADLVDLFAGQWFLSQET